MRINEINFAKVNELKFELRRNASSITGVAHCSGAAVGMIGYGGAGAGCLGNLSRDRD